MEIRLSKPFLKWAGGKRWLIKSHPEILCGDFKSYFEPFLGSGAVFFHLSPRNGVISDLNRDLINCYQCIRDDWRIVQEILAEHAVKHDDEYYYEVRGKVECDRFSRAAQLIYLNRTCWNGLYRVNRNGVFNVPRGTKNSVILPDDDFKAVSDTLRCVDIVCTDFEQTIGLAGEGDLVFVDPPYTVMHNKNGFIKYNEKIFSWEDQVRLKSSVEEASSRGAKVLVTNANHESVRELYGDGGFLISEKSRASVISGKSGGRGRSSEIIIRNYGAA